MSDEIMTVGDDRSRRVAELRARRQALEEEIRAHRKGDEAKHAELRAVDKELERLMPAVTEAPEVD